MDKIEQFITQSKINHLKRLGLCPNDDDEYQELLHQIEQKEEKCKELKSNYTTLCLIKEKIEKESIHSFLEIYESNRRNILESKARQIKEQLSNFYKSDYRYQQLLKIGNETLKEIHKIDNKRDIIIKYISNLVEIDSEDNYYEDNDSEVDNHDENDVIEEENNYDEDDVTEENDYDEDDETEEEDFIEISKAKNEEIKDQFFNIIQRQSQKLDIRNEDCKQIDLYNFFKNDYKTPDWKQYNEFKLEINQLMEKERKYTNEYGHWYLQGKKIVLNISNEEYEKICKISPPFLFRIEECIQEVYNKGYNEGHEDGYNEGYNNGYDDGYRMGD